MLAPFDDVDSSDVIRVEALTPYQTEVVNGETVATTNLAGSVTLTQDADGNDIYEFVPLDNFSGDVYLIHCC